MDAHLNAFEKTTPSCYSTSDTSLNAMVDTPRTQLTSKGNPLTKGPKKYTIHYTQGRNAFVERKKLTPKGVSML